MLDEISAAVLFLVRLIEKSENFNQEQLQEFQKHLSELLVERFENHWFPDQPCKGQGYRCIRVNERDRRDATLERAALACGFKYEDLKLPVELTLWVDPNEVCCRFGEHRGSYCTLASFNGKENKHNIELEKIEVENHKDTKSEVIPLSSSSFGANKNRRSPGRGSPKHNNHKASGPRGKGWNNQGQLGSAFPHSLPTWYTLIPRWLPPSPPPCHHHNSLVRSSTVKWNNHSNQGSPNSNYQHWQQHKGTLKV